MADTLYDEDFVTWTERQAAALRQAARDGSNLPLDFENLAEEIADLGSEKRERVESLVNAIIVHCLMLAVSPAVDPRRKWRAEIGTFRSQIARTLKASPSIGTHMDGIVAEEFADALKDTVRRLRDYDELGQAEPILALFRERPLTAREILGDGLYPVAGRRDFEQVP